MKVSESWLREFVDPPLSTAQLADALTMAGLEVEGVSACSPAFSGVVVARVLECTPHGGSPHLKVCRVDAGTAPVTVVCGAPEIRAGGLYALAMPGARLAGGREIRAAMLHGVPSEGMLCSARELGLSDEGDALLALGPEQRPGAPLDAALSLNDHVFELKLTPNRGDCLGMLGLAREVVLLTGAPLRFAEPASVPAACTDARPVRLAAPEACPRYAGRFIGDVDVNRPSPTFVTERLRRAGLRSVNVVVDITNYVMLELGQPMHAFDNARLKGGIVVRMARAGERLTLLDGRSAVLDPDMLVIADRSGAVALAGIMGGADSAVSDSTTALFLESAWFNPQAIAGRARRLGLQTDASYRFERGVDSGLQVLAVERATALILEHCGGRPGPVVDVCRKNRMPVRPAVRLRAARLERLLGTALDRAVVGQVLERLAPGVRRSREGWKLAVPSWRFDLALEEDLVEEVARIHGYDRIPAQRPNGRPAMHGWGTNARIREWRRRLAARGYSEAITYSFVDETLQDRLGGGEAAIRLRNPLASELAVMRTSLFPGLVGALRHNLARQQPRLRLFEVGRVFHGGEALRQPLHLGLIICGNILQEQWGIDDTESDFFDLKGDVEALVGSEAGAIAWRAVSHPALHPGQSAELWLAGGCLGRIGALHPGLQRDLEIPRPVFLCELDLDKLPGRAALQAVPPSRYPAVRRDIALLVDRDLPVARLLEAVRVTCPDLLHNLQLFDVYQGEGIDLGKKSLALGLTFRKTSSTLVDAEVEAALGNILNFVRKEFGATLRE